MACFLFSAIYILTKQNKWYRSTGLYQYIFVTCICVYHKLAQSELCVRLYRSILVCQRGGRICTKMMSDLSNYSLGAQPAEDGKN